MEQNALAVVLARCPCERSAALFASLWDCFIAYGSSQGQPSPADAYRFCLNVL